MVNYINLIIEMSPRFILGRENVPCVPEVVNRSLKADCTDYTKVKEDNISQLGGYDAPFCEQQYSHGSCYISLFKFKSFDQFNTPKLPQILDIYSVLAPQYHKFCPFDFRSDLGFFLNFCILW